MSDRPLLKFSWVNVALLLILTTLLVTGYFGMTNGRSAGAWLLWGHGIAAYGLLVLLFWKGQIVFDALRRKRIWTVPRGAFGLMAILLLLVLGSGLWWTFVGPAYLFGFSLISLHIYMAVLLMGLLLWHTWKMRFVFRLPRTLGRRLAMGTAVSAVIGLVGWLLGHAGKEALDVQAAQRRFTGSYERDSFRNTFPSVSWIADYPPPVNVDRWQLRIEGAVARSFTLSYNDLQEMMTDSMEAALDCTGGWYTNQLWQGVSLGKLLEMTDVSDEAHSVTVAAVSGYKRRFPLPEARGYLLALMVAERPLRHGHGFPLRLVAPDRRGYDWVKWVARIHVNKGSALWQSPLPLQ